MVYNLLSDVSVKSAEEFQDFILVINDLLPKSVDGTFWLLCCVLCVTVNKPTISLL